MDLFGLSYGVLWTLVVILFVAVFVLYRHLGQELLVGQERRMAQGPSVGSPLPSLELRDIHGDAVNLIGTRTRAALLFVATTSCRPCRDALPALGEFAERYAATIETVIACRGRNREDVVEFTTSLPDSVRIVADTQWRVGTALRIATTPFALIADGSLIVRGKGAPDKTEAFEWFREQLAQPAEGLESVRSGALSTPRQV